jgi:ABC-type multidrug transport system fused ATPase/permease subunit
MIKSQFFFRSLENLWMIFSIEDKKRFWYLLCLMMASSFAETISIGAIIPFLATLAKPEVFFYTEPFYSIFRLFGILRPQDSIFALAFFFGVAILGAACMRLLFLWAGARFAFSVGAELSMTLYRRTLYQDYLTHCNRNSSEVISGILSKVNTVIYGVLLPSISILGSGIMLIALLVALIYVDLSIALFSIGCFLCIYTLFFYGMRKRLFENGKKIARDSDLVIKSIQESLGGIRDILLDGTQEIYCREYQKYDSSLRQAQRDNLIISVAPKYLVEYIGIILFAGLVLWLTVQKGDMLIAIPLLGSLALIAQRCLPLMQQIYTGLANIHGSHASLDDVIELLNQRQPMRGHLELDRRSMQFEKEVAFEQLSFQYSSDSSLVFCNVNLKIKRGAWVGIIGETGAGKSTLIDIFMGLLPQTKGSLTIDGIRLTESNRLYWQSCIAHVPQSIFLKDGSILENIAFGIPKENIDHERLILAAKQAQLTETIKGWKAGYETLVGERGVSLSGGQRQRVGIARALYKNAEVIVLDEATSALDKETEMLVMDSIYSLKSKVTVLIISHRTETLNKCNQIIKVCKDGSINSLDL